MREVAQHALRLQKTLEDANIKLSSVASDVLGASSRAMLEDMIAGVTDPEKLADHALGRMKKKRPDLVEALRGRVSDHHRFLLRTHLRMVATAAVLFHNAVRRPVERAWREYRGQL